MQTLPQLKTHSMAALNVGVTPIELREVVYQCAPFIGFPRTLNAIETLNEVFKERGIALPLETQGTVSEYNRYEKGSDIQTPLYGTEIRDALNSLPQGMGEDVSRFLTEVCFGDFILVMLWTLKLANYYLFVYWRRWVQAIRFIPIRSVICGQAIIKRHYMRL